MLFLNKYLKTIKMVWHIKKTSMMGSAGTVYYKGDNRWTETYADRVHILLRQKQKQRIIFGIRKQPNGWDVTAVNETIMIFFSLILSFFANHLPVMYVQVPQWADDWAVCAVDIPDAKCHWYVVAPDNTFGEGFDWENAPWFDANGLNDVAPMQEVSVLEKLQGKK